MFGRAQSLAMNRHLDLKYLMSAAVPSPRTTTTKIPISQPPHIIAPQPAPPHMDMEDPFRAQIKKRRGMNGGKDGAVPHAAPQRGVVCRKGYLALGRCSGMLPISCADAAQSASGQSRISL